MVEVNKDLHGVVISVYFCLLCFPSLVVLYVWKTKIRSRESNERPDLTQSEGNEGSLVAGTSENKHTSWVISGGVIPICLFNIVMSCVVCWLLFENIEESLLGNFATDIFHYTHADCRPYEVWN